MPTDLNFDLEEMPYALEFRVTHSQGKQRFEGKRVPYNSQLTVAQCVEEYQHLTNDSLFNNPMVDILTKGHEFGLNIVWNSKIMKDLIEDHYLQVEVL